MADATIMLSSTKFGGSIRVKNVTPMPIKSHVLIFNSMRGFNQPSQKIPRNSILINSFTVIHLVHNL
ncbi:hypothetical protein BC829DRAFT_405432 [Chytridium lagenaria]|nr:hypothetical protein BC829DRAFT_405432 [Chytridium lagenaria]